VRIGLVSDTHGLADPLLGRLFQGCDLVLHAGDVGSPEVLESLGRIAPVRAVRGNNDLDAFGAALPETVRERLGEIEALVVHELWAPGRLSPGARRALRRPAGIVVFGHSHRPSAELDEGSLYLNPGSAGPKRFHLPRSAAVLEVRGRRAAFAVHDLESPGLPPIGETFRAAL
jgi:putative phosphoesterase